MQLLKPKTEVSFTLNTDEEFKRTEDYKARCFADFEKASGMPDSTKWAAASFITYARQIDTQLTLGVLNPSLSVDREKEFGRMEQGKGWALKEFERVRKMSFNPELTTLCMQTIAEATNVQAKLINTM